MIAQKVFKNREKLIGAIGVEDATEFSQSTRMIEAITETYAALSTFREISVN